MDQEKFYPALKRLVSAPDWPMFEEFLKEKQKEHFGKFLQSKKEDLHLIQASANSIGEIRASIPQLIQEVEESRKRRAKA